MSSDQVPLVVESRKPRTLAQLSDDDRRFFLQRHEIRRAAARYAKGSDLTAEQIIQRFTIDQILSGDFEENLPA